MKTRDRIISAVIDAFNDKGYHGYSLTELAHVCGMSRGNLAYHYKNKEVILDDISVKLVKDIRRFQKKRVDFPAFYNLSLDIRTCRYLQKRYPFIFRDMSVLEHSSIKDVMTNWSKEVIKSNLSTFAFGIESGHVKPEEHDGLYYHLSLNAWMLTYYWVAQQSVRELGKENVEQLVWSAIYPHFTPAGIVAFEEYYGKDFLSSKGVSIEQYLGIRHII